MKYLIKLLGMILVIQTFLFLPFYLGSVTPQAWFMPPLLFISTFGFVGTSIVFMLQWGE